MYLVSVGLTSGNVDVSGTSARLEEGESAPGLEHADLPSLVQNRICVISFSPEHSERCAHHPTMATAAVAHIVLSPLSGWDAPTAHWEW